MVGQASNKKCFICGADSSSQKIVYMHLTPKQFKNQNDKTDLVTMLSWVGAFREYKNVIGNFCKTQKIDKK